MYADNGVFIASVIVTDDSGAADTASTMLTVLNLPPVASVFPPLQQAVGIPASARFTVSDSGRQDTHTFAIRWGDGTRDSIVSGSEPWNNIVTHTYAQPGSYVVEATVRDDDGGVVLARATYPVLVFEATEHRSVAGYDVFDLGTLGGTWAKPLDFNDYGQAVGSSLTASGRIQAFLWDNGVLRDLGTLGHEGSEAQRINNAGLIAGSVWSGRSEDCAHPWNAATWRNGSGTILGRGGDLYGRYATRAAAINESGDIAWTACGHEDDYAWLWRDNRRYEFGSLLGIYGASTARSMNERGQIVGTADAVYGGDSPGAARHAFLWENGAMRDLGLFGFKPCQTYPDRNCGSAGATSINENGQVVGFSTAADGSLHAVLWENATVRDIWTPTGVDFFAGKAAVVNDVGQVAGSAGGEGFFWSDGILHMLGSLGGGFTAVVDMNEAGTVVGTSMTPGGEQHAFVWTQAQGMVDLGTGPHGFNAAWVVGISFFGDIVGYTAPCNPGTPVSYYLCGYNSQPRAIIWRNTRGSP